MTDLLQGLGEFAAEETRQAEETLLGDHAAPHREARGTAASLKRDTIDNAALETSQETGASIDNTLNHEQS